MENTSKRLRADCSFALAVSAGSSYLGQTGPGSPLAHSSTTKQQQLDRETLRRKRNPAVVFISIRLYNYFLFVCFYTLDVLVGVYVMALVDN